MNKLLWLGAFVFIGKSYSHGGHWSIGTFKGDLKEEATLCRNSTVYHPLVNSAGAIDNALYMSHMVECETEHSICNILVVRWVHDTDTTELSCVPKTTPLFELF